LKTPPFSHGGIIVYSSFLRFAQSTIAHADTMTANTRYCAASLSPVDTELPYVTAGAAVV
jgi:hypothetical protein